MAKKHKKCPSCKFKECFHSAPTCEKCGYSFVKKIDVMDDDDDLMLEEILQPVEEVPVKKTRVCGKCGFHSFHRAPKCENCADVFPVGEVIEREQDPLPPQTKKVMFMWQEWGASDLFMECVHVPTGNPTNGRVVVAGGKPVVDLVRRGGDYSTEAADVYEWCQKNIDHFYKVECKLMSPQSLYQWLVNLYHPTLVKKDGKMIVNQNWLKVRDLIINVTDWKKDNVSPDWTGNEKKVAGIV